MRLFDMDSKEDYLLDGKYKVCTPYAPLVDVIKVVRCKDCKHRYMGGDVTHYYWCRPHDRPVDDTDYCAWGERQCNYFGEAR